MNNTIKDIPLLQKLLAGFIILSLILSVFTAVIITELKNNKKTRAEQQKIVGTWVTVPEDNATPIELAFTPNDRLTVMGEDTAGYRIEGDTIHLQYLPGLGQDAVMRYRFEEDFLILTQEPDKVMRCKKVN